MAKGDPAKTFDEILAAADDPAYRRVVSVRIPFVEQALRDEHAELDTRLTDLRANEVVTDPVREAIIARLSKIEALFEERTQEFRFQNIGHRAWADLLVKHPPTDAQRKANPRVALDHNPTTFPYAAMGASCIAPAGATTDGFRALDASGMMDVAAWTELWGACLRANVQDPAPKSVAASILRRSVASLDTAASEGSLAASSSDA